ncbi:MAG: hypothetical protein CM15mP74_11570 [Halieaceae bacterium]|nr:MAG: hypothetical protein CM15mP74_11570 [Halieaceae bacterium]
MIDKTNMQGVMNVIRQAEMANSRAADASLGIAMNSSSRVSPPTCWQRSDRSMRRKCAQPN